MSRRPMTDGLRRGYVGGFTTYLACFDPGRNRQLSFAMSKNRRGSLTIYNAGVSQDQ